MVAFGFLLGALVFLRGWTRTLGVLTTASDFFLPETFRTGLIRSLTTLYPDTRREHHPAAPHACELPSRQCPRRLPRPSPRRPRTRFPSSSNSSTLSESAPWMLDNPCKSPDCSPDRAPRPSSANATVSTLWLFPRTCFLSAPAVFPPVVFLPPIFVFTSAFFGAAFFFANFFLGVALFLIGTTFLPAVLFDFVRFFLVFFLVAMRAVYHRLVIPSV